MNDNVKKTVLAGCITICCCMFCMTSCESTIIKDKQMSGYEYNGCGSIPKFTKQEQD